jgi:hypothetical protein
VKESAGSRRCLCLGLGGVTGGLAVDRTNAENQRNSPSLIFNAARRGLSTSQYPIPVSLIQFHSFAIKSHPHYEEILKKMRYSKMIFGNEKVF